jgi:hypothetical protein
MSTDAGFQPYPKVTGVRDRKIKVALSPQDGDSKMKCSTCGMAEDSNPAHASDYSGPGKHSFKGASSAKALLYDNSPIFLGGELKALGDGKVGGWAIIFSDDKSPDLTNDYFDNTTDYFFEGEQKAIRPVLYDHGLDPTMKSTKLARGTVEIKDAGLWFEAQMDLSKAYDAYIYKMAEQKALGVSTGSAPHLIQREPVGKAMHIKSWPVVEISLTPMPIEKATKGKVLPLQSYAEEDRTDIFAGFKGVVDEEDEDSMGRPHEFEEETDGEDAGVCKECGDTFAGGNHASKKALLSIEKLNELAAKKKKDGEDVALPPKKEARPVKSAFDDELAEQTPSIYRLDSARDNVLNDIVQAALLADITEVPIDLRQKITQLCTEYIARWIMLAVTQAQAYVDNGGPDSGEMSSPCGSGQQRFYLRSFSDDNFESFLSIKSVGGVRPPLNEHSDMAVSALEEYALKSESLLKAIKGWEERLEKKARFRTGDPTKSGRTISAATMKKLQDAKSKLTEHLAAGGDLNTHLDNIMALAEPKKSMAAQLMYDLAIAEQENFEAGIPTSVH